MTFLCSCFSGIDLIWFFFCDLIQINLFNILILERVKVTCDASNICPQIKLKQKETIQTKANQINFSDYN